ncbi:TrlF family AAA-like ATPase [Chryseobacterium aurantiacum]|uniref:TrlF family AAA-like ATPase n=1 Tax=Chryseobacterium aurantiacum TaxID=2116499 RepID=UPI000D116A00|nr:ATP-binding protein [Chryseobacterium aurantiacum]
MTINRGSEWRKWDLHIHSPKTHSTSNRYKDLSIEDFCKEIINKNIDVIGLTNYFYITEAEYNEVVKGLDDKCYVIPNFEFRASDKNTKGDHINFHILFNPKLGIRNILNSIGNVKLHNHTNKYCREADILQLGIDSVSIDFETILNQLKTDFKIIEDFIVCVPYTGYGGFKVDNKPRNISQEKKFDELSNFILGNNSSKEYFNSNREYTLGKDTFIIDKNKAIINCSDAHSKEDISNKFTWIKAHPTFEGLKQIIYEPIERVKIQKEKPELEKLDSLMIDKIIFAPSDNKFTTTPIYFNKNLNVIIGGKSSGKSILLYNIAKTLYENQNDSVLKYKDANDNKEKDLYDLSIDDPEFDFTVENYLGISQSIKRENGKNSILGSIKYIPQNHLSDLVDKSLRNSNELKKYIRNLLREDPKYNKIYEDFVEKLGQNDEIRKNDISQYFIYQEELRKKKEELQHKGDKESVIKSIEALESKVAETKKDLTPEQTIEYNSLTNEYSELEKIKNSLLGDLEKINIFYESTNYALNELKAKKTLLIENLELEDIKNDYAEKLNFIDDAIAENENIKKLIIKDENENFQILDNNIFNSKLSIINKRLNELNTKLAPLNSLFENQNLIINYQKTISEEKIKIAEIEQIEKETENITKTANDRKMKIFEDIKSNRKLYDNLLVDFVSRIDKIKEEDPELKIEGKIYFNFPKYREIIIDFSHGNTKSYSGYGILNEENNALIEYDFDQYLKDLNTVFENIENGNYRLKNNISKQDAIIKILEQKHFFDHWDITYKNDTIHKMSTGKASLVLLKVMIKLSEIKGPILIDQPEDNLDNRSVTNELIEYLKEKKKERQIILVTHNANIVVNADAENIIIANQRGQSDDDELGSPYLFDYINGALEDVNPISENQDEKDLLKSMGIREHITQIVEGGKEAFKKREEKYGF